MTTARRYDIFGSGGGQALADTLEVPLLGQIPIDPKLRELADVGAPIVLQAPDSEAGQALDRTAKELVNLLPPKPRATKRISLPLIPMTPSSGHEHSGGHRTSTSTRTEEEWRPPPRTRSISSTASAVP